MERAVLLVVRDAADPSMKRRKADAPALLGTDVLGAVGDPCSGEIKSGHRTGCWV